MSSLAINVIISMKYHPGLLAKAIFFLFVTQGLKEDRFVDQ
jgi:hypothetical protein